MRQKFYENYLKTRTGEETSGLVTRTRSHLSTRIFATIEWYRLHRVPVYPQTSISFVFGWRIPFSELFAYIFLIVVFLFSAFKRIQFGSKYVSDVVHDDRNDEEEKYQMRSKQNKQLVLSVYVASYLRTPIISSFLAFETETDEPTFVLE